MSKSYVIYKDVAPFAEDDATVTATNKYPQSNVSDLPHGADPGKVNTLERNQCILDGQHKILGNRNIAFWSNELSGDDCTFQNDPIIDIQFTQQHASIGITFVFDEADGNFCTSINVKWYQGDTLKENVNFSPDGTKYFAAKQVEAYTRIVITLKETSLPHRRAKINHIVFGVTRQFDMESLRSVKIINQSNLISTELPISTMDVVLESKDDIGFMFQLKQQMEAWNDNNLIGVYYIDEHERTGENTYSVGCYDAVGVLDESMFSGGYYSGVSAISLLNQIIQPYFSLDTTEITDKNLTGIIVPCTRREAMQQVLFAAGWISSTDGGQKIRLFEMDDVIKSIGKNQTYSGVNVKTSSIVTEVNVTAHTYTQSENGNVEINGTWYQQTDTVFTVKNPNVIATDKPNSKSIENGTLVSPDIGQAVAQRVYDYYLRRKTDTSKIVWKGEHIGDYVSLPTAWDTLVKGHIQKMTITLSNTVASDLEVLGIET